MDNHEKAKVLDHGRGRAGRKLTEDKRNQKN